MAAAAAMEAAGGSADAQGLAQAQGAQLRAAQWQLLQVAAEAEAWQRAQVGARACPACHTHHPCAPHPNPAHSQLCVLLACAGRGWTWGGGLLRAPLLLTAGCACCLRGAWVDVEWAFMRAPPLAHIQLCVL